MMNDNDLFELVAKQLAAKTLGSPQALDIVTTLIKTSWKTDDATKEMIALKKALDEALHEINLLRAEMKKRHEHASTVVHLALRRLPGHRLDITPRDLQGASLANVKNYRITIGNCDTFITFNPDAPSYPDMINFGLIPREAVVMTGDGPLLALYDDTIAAMHEKARASQVSDHVMYQYDDKDGMTATPVEPYQQGRDLGAGADRQAVVMMKPERKAHIAEAERQGLADLINQTLKDMMRLDRKDS